MGCTAPDPLVRCHPIVAVDLMAKLGVVLQHKQAPIATRQIRFTRGVEHLYYALLFSISPAYKSRPEIWRSWLSMGFHVAVKVPPPGTAEQDKLRVDVASRGKAPEFYGETGNQHVLQTLQSLLQEIDGIRKAVQGQDEASREHMLMEQSPVTAQLVNPLLASLKQAELRPEEIKQYLVMVGRALLALTHEDVTQMTLSLD